jgi:SulP family sulfate permease
MWVRGYRRAWLGPDLVAGAVASCVVVPQAIAYASLAGLPVQLGLYAALVPMLVYAFLGSSRPLSVRVTLEITAVAGLHDLAEDLRERGTQLWVASLTPDEQRMMERYGGEDGLPLFATPTEAVTAARASAYAGRP